MVFNTRLLFDPFSVEDFFYSFSKEPKPPTATRIVYSDAKETDVEAIDIQLALAGFASEDVKVTYDNQVLTIEGSNQSTKGISDKLSCSFKKKFAVTEKMDLPNAKVTLKNGLLSVIIPLKKPENTLKTISIQTE